MKVGIVGLGKMGAAIAHRIVQAGHEVVGFDLSKKARAQAAAEGVQPVESLAQLAQQTRIFWLMVPAGDPVDKTIDALLPNLQEGDVIVDGGNSKFSNSVTRAQRLAQKNIFFLDCGTSGGLLGKEIGFSLMIGGDKVAFEKLKPIFSAIAHKNGFAHMGPSGAGHYVKMVHNGIEYGLLQAYAEGFHLLKDGAYKELDLARIAQIWNNGGVIRSWLLELAHEVFTKDQELKNVVGKIQEGGTGQWTVDEATEKNIPVPVIKQALRVREQSRKTGGDYGTKVIAMLRNAFGGHAVEKKE